MRTILLLTLLAMIGPLAAQQHIAPNPNPNPNPTPPPNTAPIVTVKSNGTAIAANSTLQVDFLDSLASLALEILVVDGENNPCSLSATISSHGSTGIVQSEWESATAAVPVTRTPSTGTFNTVNGVTHQVDLVASDGSLNGSFTFLIQQGANTPPQISVGSLSSGGTIYVNYGDTPGSVGISVGATDADGHDVAVAATSFNVGNTGLVAAEFESATAATPYTLSPTSGSFATVAGATSFIELTADDGYSTSTFSFYIEQAPQPVGAIVVTESGNGVSHGQSAAGTNRDFGAKDAGSGATAPVVITIANSGWADLNLGSITVAGSAAGEFLMDLAGTNLTVPVGQTTTFEVAFSPVSVGTHSATIEVLHDDPYMPSPYQFEVFGVGTVPPAPAMIVREGGPGGAVISNAGTIDFGRIDFYSLPSAPVTIYVENLGNADLVLGTPAVSGSAYTIDASGLPGVIAPNGSGTFTVIWNPATTGIHTETVSITTNDATVGTFALALQGDATESLDKGSSGGGGCTAGGSTWALSVLLLLVATGVMIRRRRTA